MACKICGFRMGRILKNKEYVHTCNLTGREIGKTLPKTKPRWCPKIDI